MARDEAHTKMSADNAEMLRAYQQIEGKVDSLGRKMEGLGTRAAKGAKEGDTGILKMAAGVDLLGKGWGIAKRGLDFYMDANKQMIADTSKAAITLDDFRRKLLVTADLTPAEGKGLIAAVEAGAQTAAVPHEEAFAGAGAMLRKGFSPEETGRGIADFLTAGKIEGGKYSPEDLADVMRDLNPDDVEGAGAQLRFRTQGKAKGASDLDTLLDALRVQGKGAKMGIQMLRIDPKSVDLIGESVDDVMERLTTAMDRVGPETTQKAIGRIASRDDVGDTIAMIRRGRMPDSFRADYAELSETTRTGPAARSRRTTAEFEQTYAKDESGAETLDVGTRLRTVLKERGESAFEIAYASLVFDMAKWLRASDEQALNWVTTRGSGRSEAILGKTEAGRAEYERIRNSDKITEANTAATKELVGATKQLADSMRGGAHHVEPQRPKAKPVQGATK